MSKTKVKIIFSIFLAMVFGGLIFLSTRTALASESCEDANNISESESVQPRGLFTSLSISINGGDGKVWVTVKNDLTVLPSKVYVVVQLFSSETYLEDYNDMVLTASNSTLDLNMGESIVAEASTESKQKYWIGRMRYRVDVGAWKEKTVGPAIYDGNGNFIGI